MQRGLRSLHLQGRVRLVAVDEAHLVCEWADFRPAYLFFTSWFTSQLPNVRKIALTATAPTPIRPGIVQRLQLHQHHETVLSMYRPSLELAVFERSTRDLSLGWLVSQLKEKPELTLVYVPTTAHARTLAAWFVKQGLRAAYYYKTRTEQEREVVHTQFSTPDVLDVLVATVAFGMGIDNPRVRHVVHCASCPVKPVVAAAASP